MSKGTQRQHQAYFTLTEHQILAKLQRFFPLLVGTIPINIYTEKSDLDIICSFIDSQDFINAVTTAFQQHKNFSIREKEISDVATIVANFVVDTFEVEVFGQTTPVKQQLAYRHLVIEHKLLNRYGEKFRQQIIALKQQGHKTEPAFAIALGLSGDSYLDLLKFEKD